MSTNMSYTIRASRYNRDAFPALLVRYLIMYARMRSLYSSTISMLFSQHVPRNCGIVMTRSQLPILLIYNRKYVWSHRLTTNGSTS
eukprot:1456485-Pyramimonas_sp.AAC.1